MLPTFDRSRCLNCLLCSRGCPMGVIGTDEDGRPCVLPRRRCIECMHCVSICPAHAVQFEGIPEDALYRPDPESPVERLIARRRSVRRFKTTLPERSVIKSALDAAEYAPSGKNAHATRWIVLWGRDTTDKVTQMVLDICRTTGEAPELPKLYGYGTNLITCSAPVVIVGWSPEDCLNPVIDTAVAMSTLELLLQEKGLSTCWGGYLCQVANHNEGLRRKLGVPDGSRLRCALMVGYPDREPYRTVPYRPEAPAAWLECGDLED